MRHRSAGFSLIELLVVVAIIALLLAVLLPALNHVREQSRTVVCATHLRQCGLGLQGYTTEHHGWLAGPNTSGSEMSLKENRWLFYHWVPSSIQPTVNTDWISPTMGQVMGFPEDRVQRAKAIFNTELCCPSNHERFASQFSGSMTPWGLIANTVRYTSYSAMLLFQGHGGTYSADLPFPTTAISYLFDASGDPMLDIPSGYVPRIEKVGNTSRKVYATEGARYIDEAGLASFNPFHWQRHGGNWMSLGPTFGPIMESEGSPYRHDPVTLQLTPEAKRYAYRHHDKINELFFDGHVSLVNDAASIKVGMYVPKGTVILDPTAVYDRSVQAGYVVNY